MGVSLGEPGEPEVDEELDVVAIVAGHYGGLWVAGKGTPAKSRNSRIRALNSELRKLSLDQRGRER